MAHSAYSTQPALRPHRRYPQGRRQTPADAPTLLKRSMPTKLVEYVEQGQEYGILFTFSLFREYVHLMLGGWLNPHREQQTIPQGQTSIPPKSFSTPTANGQSAPRSGSTRGVGRGAGSHTPSTASESFSPLHTFTRASSTDNTRSTHFTLTQRHR